ncbi:hypothetical protein [Rhodococcus koreensis]
MAFREVNVNEVKEVLRVWLGVPGSRPPGLRTIAAHCGVDPKTARRYIEAAQAAGLQRSDGVDALDDGLIGTVIEAVRPARPSGHGPAWDRLLGFEDQITAWVAGDGNHPPLTITKIDTLLAPSGLCGAVSDVAPIRHRAMRFRSQGHHRPCRRRRSRQ